MANPRAAWATPERCAEMCRAYPLGDTVPDICARLRAMPGPELPHLHTVATYMVSSLNLRRAGSVYKPRQRLTASQAPVSARRSRSPLLPAPEEPSAPKLWTLARADLHASLWCAGVARSVIVVRLNALPGLPMTLADVEARARRLGLSRPVPGQRVRLPVIAHLEDVRAIAEAEGLALNSPGDLATLNARMVRQGRPQYHPLLAPPGWDMHDA